MDRHTAGPWFSGPICKDEWDNDMATVGPFPTGEGTDRPKGEVHHESTICEVWGGNHDCAANAALIAAAPNMLQALRAVQRALYETGRSGQSSKIYRTVLAAIAEATTPEPRNYVDPPISESSQRGDSA